MEVIASIGVVLAAAAPATVGRAAALYRRAQQVETVNPVDCAMVGLMV
ncbi:hypothetical protein AB0E01_19260 [Nocardia vinacea]